MRLSSSSAFSIIALALAAIATGFMGNVLVAQSKTAAAGQATFTRDVVPILQQHCQVCHRPDSMAPMSLLTYEDVRPWAKSIRNKVVAREMPPWFIDRTVGISKFKNDESLTDAEIATVSKWVDGGAPLGNPADMPRPRTFESADKWHFTPDVIIEMPKSNHVPAQGPDLQTDNIVSLGLTEDRWIQAIEVKPVSGYTGIHHLEIYTGADEETVLSHSNFLCEYAVGKGADIYGENSGRLVKAGTYVTFQLHLHPNGQEVDARAAVAIKFWPRGFVPKYKYQMVAVGWSNEIDIPPNTDNVRFDGYSILNQPTRLLSFQPHMHNRGKAMCVEAIIPQAYGSIDGDPGATDPKVQTLSCVDRYRFAWHRNYLYAEDVQPLLPAGTVLHVIGWKDNTAANRFNPDPEAWVGVGDRTIDEMNFAWMSMYSLTDEDYKHQVAERKQLKKTTSDDQRR
jgi:mono/diheme cytochrome c family protein